MMECLSVYRSKPQYVEALQWTGDNYVQILNTYGEKVNIIEGELELKAGKDGAQDWVPVPRGHWLVCPVNDFSDIWPVEEEYFANKYELA